MSSPSRATKRLKTGTTQQASLTSFFGAAPKAPNGSALAAAARKDTTTTESNNGTKTDGAQKTKESPPVPTTTDPIIPQTVPWNASAWKVHENAVIYRKAGGSSSTADPVRTKVAAFDMDGTLLAWRTSGWPSKLSDYELWNSAVITKLRNLHDDEHYQLVIISNQGAIRSAFAGKKATTVKALVEWIVATVDRPISVVLSTDKKKGFHKPSVKLWQAAQQLLGSASWSIKDSFYVGDSVGDDGDAQGGVDVALARNVSQLTGQTLRFYTPDDFFGPSHAQQRQSTVVVKPIPPKVLTARATLCSGLGLAQPFVLLLCGAQGSGKSTVAQRLVDGGGNWAHFSQDTIRNGKPGKREQVEAAVKQAIGEGNCVIVDRMHLDASQREPFVQLALQLGVPIHAVVLTPPKAVVAQRVKERQNHPGKVEGESGARIATASAGKLVFPTYDEGFALISGTSSPDVGVNRLVRLYQQVVGASSQPPSIPSDFTLTISNADQAPVTLPAIILGTMGIGRRAAEQVVTEAMQIGLQGVDTASTYKNEDKIGSVLSKDAFAIVKVPKRATTAQEVQTELQTSLQNLQRSQADLLLLHWPSLPSDALKQVWQAMEAAVKEGKAKALGVCNANVAALAGLLPQCRIPPVVLQIERHPLLPQWDVLDFCAQHDIQVQAHTPLGQGKSDLLEHEVVKKVVSSHPGTSAAQVVLAWNLQQGVAVVPKASTAEHLKELTSIPRLTQEDLQALNDITDRKRFVAPPFMYGSAPYCWGKQAPK